MVASIAFLRAGLFNSIVTMGPSRRTAMVSTSRDDTDEVGFNPHRKYVPKRSDIALVVVALALALGLVLWAFLG
jgi:hypothetical protein